MHRVSSSSDQSYSSNSKDSSSNENSMGSSEFQPPLFKLAKRSKWGKLLRFLKVKGGHACYKECDETGLTLLGVAIGYGAPIEVIEQIVSVDPTQLTVVDIFGANSLHIACLNGASPLIVTYILSQCPELATLRDKHNRSPLHHATECIYRNEIDYDEGKDVIEILCQYNALMIHDLDDNHNSPLDLVHIAQSLHLNPSQRESLDKLNRQLRRISFKVYKLKKKCWENKIPLKSAFFSSSKTARTDSTDDSSVGSNISR